MKNFQKNFQQAEISVFIKKPYFDGNSFTRACFWPPATQQPSLLRSHGCIQIPPAPGSISEKTWLVQPLHPCTTRSWECPLLTCFYHKFLHVGAIILLKLQKSLWEKNQQWIICRFFFLPPSSPTTPVLKIRHRNNSQQQFRQVCACIWYKQTKICAFCFIELTSIWQNLNHKTEILWLINTSGDEK